MVLKELIFNTFYYGILAGCGFLLYVVCGLERTHFNSFYVWSVVVLKELIFNSFYFNRCGGLERTDF